MTIIEHAFRKVTKHAVKTATFFPHRDATATIRIESHEPGLFWEIKLTEDECSTTGLAGTIGSWTDNPTKRIITNRGWQSAEIAERMKDR